MGERGKKTRTERNALFYDAVNMASKMLFSMDWSFHYGSQKSFKVDKSLQELLEQINKNKMTFKSYLGFDWNCCLNR